MKEYEHSSEVLTQSHGAYTVDTGPNALSHWVYVVPEAGATGTVAISYKPRGSSAFVELVDSTDTPIVFSLAAPGQPAIFSGDVEQIKFTPTSVTEGFKALASGWMGG